MDFVDGLDLCTGFVKDFIHFQCRFTGKKAKDTETDNPTNGHDGGGTVLQFEQHFICSKFNVHFRLL